MIKDKSRVELKRFHSIIDYSEERLDMFDYHAICLLENHVNQSFD